MVQKFNPKEAEAIMLMAGLQPLEPYESAHANWKSLCLICRSIVAPRWATIQSGKGGCKTCRYRKIAKAQSFELVDVINFIAKYDGKLISKEYKNVGSSLEFKCSRGHTFQNSFGHIKRGQWCPTCNKGSKSEEMARAAFEHLFGYKFRKIRPKWLRNSRGFQMEIDGYCSELEIGFEYQGIQHFKEIKIWNKNDDTEQVKNLLQLRMEDDKQKIELCSKHGIKLFVLNYEMPFETFGNEIITQLEKFGLSSDIIVGNLEIDFSQAYIRDDRLLELIEIMNKKSIQVLSTKWIDVKTKYEFKCRECGHTWKATGSSFFNSRSVSGCDKCARQKAGDKQRGKLSDIQAFALSYQGKVLSNTYSQRNFEYEFECKSGHKFKDNYNNMVYRKQFCPVCENRNQRKHYTEEESLEILTKYGLKPLSVKPKRANQYWPVQCLVCGENTSISFRDLIARGKPCKYCSGAMISEKVVRKVFVEAKLEPLEPFRSGSAPWKARCLTCGTIVNGRYTNLTRGQSGCRQCYLNSLRKNR